MMSSLSERFEAEARHILSNHPNLKHEWRNQNAQRAVLVFPASERNGFEVVVEAGAAEIGVRADGAQVAFCASKIGQIPDVIQEALGFVRDLSSPGMRLRTRHAGGRAYKWILEHPAGDGWRPEHVTGLLLFDYLGRRTETIRQNHQ